jgi:hypothetical protein
MEGMNGVDLAAKLTADRPTLKVLLMSGVTDGMLVLNEGWHFLPKPFIPHNCARWSLALYPEKPTRFCEVVNPAATRCDCAQTALAARSGNRFTVRARRSRVGFRIRLLLTPGDSIVFGSEAKVDQRKFMRCQTRAGGICVACQYGLYQTFRPFASRALLTVPGSSPKDGVIENQHDHGADNRHEETVDVEPVYALASKNVEQPATGKSADNTQKDVEQDALAPPVYNLAADVSRNQAENDPGKI